MMPIEYCRALENRLREAGMAQCTQSCLVTYPSTLSMKWRRVKVERSFKEALRTVRSHHFFEHDVCFHIVCGFFMLSS